MPPRRDIVDRDASAAHRFLRRSEEARCNLRRLRRDGVAHLLARRIEERAHRFDGVGCERNVASTTRKDLHLWKPLEPPVIAHGANSRLHLLAQRAPLTPQRSCAARLCEARGAPRARSRSARFDCISIAFCDRFVEPALHDGEGVAERCRGVASPHCAQGSVVNKVVAHGVKVHAQLVAQSLLLLRELARLRRSRRVALLSDARREAGDVVARRRDGALELAREGEGVEERLPAARVPQLLRDRRRRGLPIRDAAVAECERCVDEERRSILVLLHAPTFNRRVRLKLNRTLSSAQHVAPRAQLGERAEGARPAPRGTCARVARALRCEASRLCYVPRALRPCAHLRRVEVRRLVRRLSSRGGEGDGGGAGGTAAPAPGGGVGQRVALQRAHRVARVGAARELNHHVAVEAERDERLATAVVVLLDGEVADLTKVYTECGAQLLHRGGSFAWRR